MNQDIHQLYMARKSKDFKSIIVGTNIELKQSPLAEAIEEGENKQIIYHYTNIGSLFKILETGCFRFSRIDRVNDLLEKKQLIPMDMYKRVFVACFNHEMKESIPLWKIYTSRGNGVRIGLLFKEDRINSHFINYNGSFLDSNNQRVFQLCKGPGPITKEISLNIIKVYYTDEAYTNRWLFMVENQISITPDDFAYSKSKEWEYEKETRLVLFHRNLDAEPIDTEYILVPVDFCQLNSIEVRFDPWMSPELKECYKVGLKKYEIKWNVKINFLDSELQEKIG